VDIRDATPEDAFAACEVMRKSISELCIADHANDPAILASWLNNKKPEIVAAWSSQPGNSLLVAVELGVVLGVGSVTDAGEITLVAPSARFRGVSRALLAALEKRAVERGNVKCTLNSTETAHRYRSAGYTMTGSQQGSSERVLDIRCTSVLQSQARIAHAATVRASATPSLTLDERGQIAAGPTYAPLRMPEQRTFGS
jgi:GNAT superfamily N-acetyltransferase